MDGFIARKGKVMENEWIEKHIDEMVRDICKLSEIPSVSIKTENPDMPFGQACLDALHAALDLGKSMGFEPFNHENYCGTILWKGESDTEIGFFGHADVVPAGNGWTCCQPFKPVVKDGILIGRGVSDNKGSFMTALYALRYLKEQGYKPKHSFRFYFGCDEEKGMSDLQYYTEHYKEPAFSIVPDVMFPVCNGEKGILEFNAERPVKSNKLVSFQSGIMSNQVPAEAYAVLTLTEDENAKIKEVIKAAAGTVEKLADGNVKVYVHGIPAHAAFPEGSESAEVKLAGLLIRSGVLDEDAKELMEAICDMFGDYYGAGLDVPFEDEGSGKLTHVGGMCKLENGVFWQNVNIRYNVTAVYEVMMENIGKCLKAHGFELTGSHNSSPCFTDPDSKEVQALLEVCCRSLGMELEPYVMGGGTYSRKLKHAVGFGPGIPGKEKRFGTERGGAHQADEYIEIEHLKKAFEIYVEAIKKLDEVVD